MFTSCIALFFRRQNNVLAVAYGHILPNGTQIADGVCAEPYAEMAATAHSRALYYAQADKILPWRYCHVCKVGIEKVEAFCSFARRHQATLGCIAFLDGQESEPEYGAVLRSVYGLAIVHAIVWHFG